jgi:hypothetical protein
MHFVVEELEKRGMPLEIALLPMIDEYFAPASGRPHWGKLFQGTALGDRYPRFDDFVALVESNDPHGRFANDWWRAVLTS